ncbi:MAG: LPS-assembly protein LptD [Porticoccaceae bacterium]|nr:LPS-assembly protein LptD [Porticoccaceae bacterium]
MNEISSIQQSTLFVAIQWHRSALTGILAAIAVGASLTVSADEPRVAEVRNLDWVEADQMNKEQLSSVASNCCGAYIEPERTYPDADLDPEEASLLVNANTTETLPDDVALLDGDIQISQGYRQIRSDSARIDQTNRTVVLNGNVQFREPGLLLLGSNAEIDIDSKEVQIADATYVLHEASVRGKAENLQRTKDGVITISDATYSTCEPGDSTWQMATSEIAIDQESGFATVKNAQLRVKDIPVFYFPWIKFPVNDRRSSGLLFPALQLNSSNGLDYAQPIYWNLAEHYDATITPRLIQERGIGMELEFRHLSQYSNTQVTGAFLGDDRGGKDDKDIDPNTGLPEHRGEDRYQMGLNHLGGIGKSWSTFLDINRVSDNDYLGDLGTMTRESISRINLRRVAGATYKTKHWDFLVEARDNQIVVDGLEEQYSVLPKININGYYRFDNSLVVDLNNQTARFDHDDEDFVTGSRTRLDYGISWDKRWSWGYFRPQFRVKHLSYNLDSEGTSLNNQSPSLNNQSPSVTVPVTSLDSSLFFERDASWFSNYKQTLEPRLYYLKANYRDQSDFPDFDTREFTPSYDRLFRDERFNGGDRISDEDRLTIAFTTRYIDKKSGQERFTASIAQSINYIDRRITLSEMPTENEIAELSRRQSPLALKLSGRMNVDWRFTSDIIYDTHDNELEKSSISLRYNDRQNRLFNATYRSTKRDPRLFEGVSLAQDIRQVDISGFVPLAGNFNLVGRWNHDFTNSRELDVFAGFEYNSCCWRASLVARRWLDRRDEVLRPEEDLTVSNGIFFQIQFKGLAGSGGRVDSMLNNGIYGYGSEENL